MGKSKYSKEVKQDTLAFGYYERVKEDLKASYFGDYNKFWSLAKEKATNQYCECAILLYHSQKQRRFKVHQKVREMITSSKEQVFVTLTWNETRYHKLDTDKRRRLVQRWLKKWCEGAYLANLDINENVHQYADKNGEVHTSSGREHYHCLIVGELPQDALTEWFEKQGAINVKKVRHGSTVQVANYCVKLGLHALKSEALDKRIIYSRKTSQNA